MCASCGVDGADADQLQELGLVVAHAYTLKAVMSVTTEEGEEITLVQLRNPWGNFEWNGDWSDHSELWTDDLIA